jgi:hypothetical protein
MRNARNLHHDVLTGTKLEAIGLDQFEAELSKTRVELDSFGQAGAILLDGQRLL